MGFCWSLNQGVALMQCDTALTDRGEEYCGVVYHGYDTLLRGMREAMADERVKGLFIRLSTPGGVVAGGLPALAAFMRANGARAGGKPIWVYADMACSAGYWIAASADRIIAPRVGLIGSIGASSFTRTGPPALKEHGVAIEAIQFGAKKTDGAWWSKLSERAREDLQAEIDQCGRDFVADVMAGRPSSPRKPFSAPRPVCSWPPMMTTPGPAGPAAGGPAGQRGRRLHRPARPGRLGHRSPFRPLFRKPRRRRAEGARLGFPCENRKGGQHGQQTQGGR